MVKVILLGSFISPSWKRHERTQIKEKYPLSMHYSLRFKSNPPTHSSISPSEKQAPTAPIRERGEYWTVAASRF